MSPNTRSDIVFDATTHVKRAVALGAAAQHAAALRTVAEAALPVPPAFGNVEVVDVVAAVRILKENCL